MYTKPRLVASESYDDVLKKLVPGTTEFLPRLFPFSSNPISRKLDAGFNMSTPGTSTHSQVFFWQSLFLVGEMLDGEGSEFKQWALEELTAFGKASYRKKDNVYVPILTDGTNLEGYVVKEDGPLGPKGVTLEPVPAGPSDLWAYAQGYRVTGDEFMWDMARSIAVGNEFGDIGATPSDGPQVKISTDCSDPYALLAFLELHRATGRNDFLKIAKEIGDNILEARFHKGFFVASNRHIYAKFDAIYPLVLLHLHLALMEETPTISKVWPNTPFFEMSYRKKDVVIDNQIIYTLTESTEPPISLQEAAAVGDIDLVRSIIEKVVGVDAREDCFYYTALHRAVMGGHTDVVKLLLIKGADVDVRGGPDSETPLHYAAMLRTATDIVEILITNGADVNAKNAAGETPLHYAAEHGSKDMAELLIDSGADVNAKDSDGQTPVDIAVSRNRKNVVELLIAKGANASLHTAVRGGHKDIVELLLAKGADVNAKNNEGRTASEMAMVSLRPQIVKLLANNGAEISSIHLAASVGDLAKVKAFLQKGIDINARDSGGRIPLHYAVTADVAEFFISNGADIHAGDKDGETPLHTVARAGCRGVVELLITKGADVDAKKSGYTPLSYAVQRGHKDVIRSLVNHGADINFVADGDWPFLHYAGWNNDKNLVKFFVDHGAKLNVKDGGGWTVLHYAVHEDYKEIVEYLVSKGADVNVKNNEGWTPLYYAQDYGYAEIVELLRKHGAKEDEVPESSPKEEKPSDPNDAEVDDPNDTDAFGKAKSSG
jgi:cytohesin